MVFAFTFSHPKRGRQTNAFKHDEKKQAFTGNWQLNTSLKNMRQPDKASAPTQKQAAGHVMISQAGHADGGCTSELLLLSRSLQKLVYFMAYLEEVKRLDHLSVLEELEGFPL